MTAPLTYGLRTKLVSVDPFRTTENGTHTNSSRCTDSGTSVIFLPDNDSLELSLSSSEPEKPDQHSVNLLGFQTRAEAEGEESGFLAAQAQPGPEDTMEWHGGRMRTRRSDQLAILKVCECALDGASGEPCGGGD
jgi:hypothetical protein